MKVLLALCFLFACAYGLPRQFAAPMNGRIIGGIIADPGEFPSIISLRYLGTHRCGGMILSKTHVLTAAHCVTGVLPGSLNCWAGAHNNNQPEESQQRIGVRTIVVHSAWHEETINNDIAILTLAGAFDFNVRVQPIHIAYEGHEPSGPVMNIGWGLLANGAVLPPVQLHKVQIEMHNRTECQRIYAGVNAITPAMICAADPDRNAGSCNGDSGSPLIASDLGANKYAAGLVSWGIQGNCGNPAWPSVFTRVSHFTNWIRGHAPDALVIENPNHHH